MRRILASLLAVLALSLSLGACGTPSENHHPTKKMQVNRQQLLCSPNETKVSSKL